VGYADADAEVGCFVSPCLKRKEKKREGAFGVLEGYIDLLVILVVNGAGLAWFYCWRLLVRG